ncbi:hypothetical protein KEM55_004204 [Ascosphaera atra]|nr:hypothetical protein KEM55_004204 [Ascosphaera atra]
MFRNYIDQWPQMPNNNQRMNGPRVGAPSSVAGDSVAATESDAISSVVDGRQGGVSLGGLSIHDVKPTSVNQSDRLKRYVELGNQPLRPGAPDASSMYGDSSINVRLPRRVGGHLIDDDDARSVSTAFASQIGGSYD